MKNHVKTKISNLCLLKLFDFFLWGLTIFASGQLIVGGRSPSRLSSVEIFPPPSSDTCSIPDLPGPREPHSLSLLSRGRLVVCGGRPTSEECIVWTGGSTSWMHLHTTRSSYYHIIHTNKVLTFQRGKRSPCGLGSNISSQLHRAARRPWCRAHCRDCARFWEVVKFSLLFIAGGGTFELRHSGQFACGIPEEDTIVMTGGIDEWPNSHDYVTRWSFRNKLGFTRVLPEEDGRLLIILSQGDRPPPHHHHRAKMLASKPSSSVWIDWIVINSISWPFLHHYILKHHHH